jgi:hypothetical protein
MSDELSLHRKFAVDLFNYTWELLDKTNRTQEDDDTMLNAAHASRFHWEKAGGPLNLARGEWQVSRVYCVLKRSEPALYHARRCLEVCETNDIGDFDLAYAYEAMARACAIAEQADESRRFLAQAIEAGKAIVEEDDREIFEKDIQTIPGYK